MRKPIFQSRVLVDCTEVSVSLPEDTLDLRIEIFVHETGMFSSRVWRLEHFRIQATFPQVEGKPRHSPSDEVILKEFEGLDNPLEEPQSFASAQMAREYVMVKLAEWLDRSGGISLDAADRE